MSYPQEPTRPDADGAVLRPPGPTVPAPRTASTYTTGTLSRSSSAPAPQAEEALDERTGEHAHVVDDATSTGESTAVAERVPGVLARAAVDTRTAARPDALPAPSAPPRRPGTLYYSGRRPDERGRRMSRLQVGTHIATPAALEHLAPPSPTGGLLIGMDRQQQPVLLRLFQPRPTSVVVLGREWAAGILAFRAAGMGARVLVVGGNQDAWQRLGAAVVGDGQPLPASAPDKPILLVRRDATDAGVPSHTPWHARLTLVPQLDHATEATVERADLVLTQRLETREARALARLRKLGHGQWEALASLEPEMLGLLADGARRSVWLSPTRLERQLLGLAPR